VTLVEFLRARLDEDEAAVWRYDSDGQARIATMWTGGAPGYTTVAGDHRDDVWVAGGREVWSPRHVHVLWDAQQVLAGIAARRAVVDAVAAAETAWESIQDTFAGDRSERARVERASYSQAAAAGHQILAHLAGAHSGHPDYQEAWRPCPAR